MVRPIKYITDKERLGAIKQSKTKYMLNKEWCCSICGDKDYKLAGKWTHLNTKKHKNKAEIAAMGDIQ